MENQTETKPEVKKDPAGMDLFTSILLMAFSLGVVYLSLQMPRPGGWSSAPGLLPFLLCGCTFFMSLSIFYSSIRKQGPSKLIAAWRSFSPGRSLQDIKTRRVLLIVVLIALFIFVLIGRMPFELAIFLYLAVTLAAFWRKGGWLTILLVSVLTPLALGGIFRGAFGVALPGGSVFEWLRMLWQ